MIIEKKKKFRLPVRHCHDEDWDTEWVQAAELPWSKIQVTDKSIVRARIGQNLSLRSLLRMLGGRHYAVVQAVKEETRPKPTENAMYAYEQVLICRDEHGLIFEVFYERFTPEEMKMFKSYMS